MSSHLVGQRVDSLLQAVVLRVQQGRLFALEGAVGVGVLSELADHGELWSGAGKQESRSQSQPKPANQLFSSPFVLFSP